MNLSPIYASASMSVKPVPFRLRALRSLTAALETIHPDNGYHHDLRGRTFRGRAAYGTDDPIPMLSILEAPIPAEELKARGNHEASIASWELLVQGFCEDDHINPSDPAHHLMAEVKAALIQEKRRDRGNNILSMDGRVVEMWVGQGTVRPPEDPSSTAFFWLTLTLRIAEDLSQPYA